MIDVAAAYLFHLAQAHGYRDGNKRVALAAMITFLEINGFDTDLIAPDDPELKALTLGIASGAVDKVGSHTRLRALLGE